MKTVFEHLEHVKGKPHHVRKRVAFGAAASLTALVALVWFVGTLSAGVLAIQGSSFAQSAEQESVAVTGSDSGNQNQNGNLAGAAAALPAGQSSGSASGPARIEIVTVASSTTGTQQADETTIPF